MPKRVGRNAAPIRESGESPQETFPLGVATSGVTFPGSSFALAHIFASSLLGKQSGETPGLAIPTDLRLYRNEWNTTVFARPHFLKRRPADDANKLVSVRMKRNVESGPTHQRTVDFRIYLNLNT